MGSPAAYYSLILAITLSITGAHEVIMAFALSSTAFKDGAARQGRTDFRRPGYGGPCPPPGPAHRYFFKLYALDAPPNLKAGAQKKDVEAAMQGHVLGTAQLMGTYARQKR